MSSPYGNEPTRPLEPWPGYQPRSASEPEPTRALEPYGQAPAPQQQAWSQYPPVPGGYPPPGSYPVVDPRWQNYQAGLYAAQKSRVAAGLLGLFLGGLGIHNFYLGRVGVGVAQLLISLLSLGFLAPLVWIWALIESILILTRSPSFATDAKGIPLRD